MSRAFGPFALTAGVTSTQALPPSIRWLRVKNDSIYDLAIQLGGVEPSFQSTLNGAFTDVLLAGERAIFDVAAGALITPQVGGPYWDGNFYYAAMKNTQNALSGSFSGRANLWLTGYEDDEQPAYDDAVSPRTVDLSSQPRVIALPPSPSLEFDGIFIPAAGGGSTALLATFDPVNGRSGPFYLSALTLSSNVAAGLLGIAVDIQGYTPTPTLYATFRRIARISTITPFIWSLAMVQPLYAPIAPNAPGEADTVRISLILTSGVAVAITVHMAYDLNILNATESVNITGPGLAPNQPNNQPVW